MLSLTACGGGSSDSNDTQQAVSQAILVNAGANITLNENDSISLLGGSSGGEGAITYRWEVDAAVQITHPDTSVTNATLVAPSTTQALVFSLTLVATDTKGNNQSDTISLNVKPVNLAPVAVVMANQTLGYASNSFPVTTEIMLNGSTSSDADAPSDKPPIAVYLWQQIAGPGMLGGIDTSTASITLISPILDETQQATFRLTVTDQEQASSSADYSITLLNQQQTLPSIEISPVRTVFSGELILLSGTADSIAPNAAPFTAQWTASAASQIDDSTAFSTVAISPLVQQDTTISYQLTATDSFRNSISAQQNGQVNASTVRTINDTGVTKFASANSVSQHYQLDYPGQDADYGADRQRLSGQVVKVGEGAQGFDFTRLDNNGDAVENPSFAFSCVRDNVTGLIWQVKDNQNTGSIHFVEQTVTWFADEDNGNFAGELNPASTTCNVQNQQCNTQDYTAQVNAQGLCGFYDWRLPKPNELQSIVNYGKATPPMVDTVFFPFLGGNNAQQLWYWTSQSSADGVSDDIANNAWAYDLNSGNDGFLQKSTLQRIILVRAGR